MVERERLLNLLTTKQVCGPHSIFQCIHHSSWVTAYSLLYFPFIYVLFLCITLFSMLINVSFVCVGFLCLGTFYGLTSIGN